MAKRQNKWYQETEALLFAYKSFSMRIGMFKRDIEMMKDTYESPITPVYELRGGTSYRVSSPVERTAIQCLALIEDTEKHIRHLENLKEVVETSIDIMLDDEQKKLVNLVYNQEMPWQQVCEKMGMDKNTFYIQKNGIVNVLAWAFGYLSEEEAEGVLGLFVAPEAWNPRISPQK